jgi:uncharacterized protein (DUF885 family)
MKRRHLLLAAASPLAPLGVAGCASPRLDPPARFSNWAEAFCADWVRQWPEWTTQMQYFEPAEQRRIDHLSNPPVGEQRTRMRAMVRPALAEVEAFLAAPATSPQALTPAERVSALTLRFGLQRALRGEPFERHRFAFNQLWGWQVRVPNYFANSHPLRRPDDLSSWFARLSTTAARIDDGLADAREGALQGLVPPGFIVERALTQTRAFLAFAPAENPIVAGLAERSQRMPGLAAEERNAALARTSELVQRELLPAWRRIEEFLLWLQPRARTQAGIGALPDGAAAYREALAGNTTSLISPDEVHDLGLAEVARIEQQMERLLRALGHEGGTVDERLQRVREGAQAALLASLAPGGDPRPQLLARYAAYMRDAELRAGALFNLRPRAPVEVLRVGPLTERTAAAHYITPAPDGSRPGQFWVPLPGPGFNLIGMRTLAYHEAVPGHHFQLALLQEMAALPRWRRQRIFSGGSAHAEGWALYAEYLAIEQGWYRSDPLAAAGSGGAADLLGELGAWDAQRFRARRLVVDSGLHAKGWSREQAIAYGISASEVERYVSNPGQACAYMVGKLRILESREQARSALGARFDLKAFHDLVLKTGSVPLDVLAAEVQRWAQAADAPVKAPVKA